VRQSTMFTLTKKARVYLVPMAQVVIIAPRVLFGVVLLISVLFLVHPRANSYYAAPKGSGSSCSSAQPCSLNNAIDKARSGDEVILKDGTYDNQQVRTRRSGNKDNPIVIRAENRHKAIVAKGGYSGHQSERTCPILHSHITLKGIICDGKGSASIFGIDGTANNPITGILVEDMIIRNGHG